MTRKDFELVAAALNSALLRSRDYGDTSDAVTGAYAAIHDVTDALAANYPNFNRDRFEAACTKGAQ